MPRNDTGSIPWLLRGVKSFFDTQGQIPASGFPSRDSNKAPYYGGSPAPGAPGAGGAQYVSPFQGRRDANIGLLRSRGYGIPSAAAAITTGLDSRGNIDRTQSDQYRAAMGQRSAAAGPAAPQYPSFPLTPQGQFERYFSSGSPEMDRYFGAASRGAGAPSSLADMNRLASLDTSKASPRDLATYYRAQSAAGQGNMEEIVAGLKQGLDPMKASAMEQWARHNQMLAYREYNKKFPGGAPAQSAAAATAFGAVPTPGSAAAEPVFNGALQGMDFNINPVAAPPGTQGQNPTDAVKYLQSAYTNEEPKTATEKVDALLGKWGMLPGQRSTMIGG